MRAGWILAALSCVVVALVVCNSSPLQAADDKESSSPSQRAETHSRLGVEYYQQGLYKEAVREMMLAYEAVPDAMLLYNVGRIYQRMEQGDLAIGFLKRFVAHEGADPDTVQDALGHMETLSRPPGVAPQSPESVESFEELPATQSTPPTDAADPEPAVSGPPQASFSPAALPVAVAGVGFVSMAITGALSLATNQRSKDATLSWEDRTAARGQAEELALAADISLGVGIAASVASVIALVIQRRGAAGQQTELLLVPAGPAPGPGLTLSGRFGRAGGSR